MHLYDAPLWLALLGLVLYTVLGGADFGAGFWQLTAGRGREAARLREQAHKSMGPHTPCARARPPRGRPA